MRIRWTPVTASALLVAGLGVVASAGAAPSSPAPHKLSLTVLADHETVSPYQDIGFTMTVINNAQFPLQDITLHDDLPAGGDLSWALDAQTGISGCTTTGEVGAQSIACPRVTLNPGTSYEVHVLSHTSSSTETTVANAATATATGGASAGSGTETVTGDAAVTLKSADCRATPPDTNRTLAFDDEFSSDTIDTSKWTAGSLPFGGLNGSTRYHNRQYGSYIQPENSQVRDGTLDLIANNIPVTDPDIPSIGTIPYTEGMVHTKNKFSRTGGYFEICAKFPNGKGLWPAFWLAAQNGNWPPEMDVAEWFGSLKAMQIGQPFATGPNAGNMWQSTWLYSAAPTTGWHDYAMWWTTTSPATIRYYVDGQMVHEIDGTTANLISNTPMYLILNSGTWAPASRGGPPDATTVFPNAFQIDYVRVYPTPPPQQVNSAP